MNYRNNFVHLDVKPANILKKGDRYKLGDFGLALHLEDGQAAPEAIEEGDCRYMARELLDWGPVKDLAKCDVFSLGVTAYELATNTSVPANGPLWQSMRDGSFTLPAHVSSEMTLVLRALLNPEPTDRPSAEECLASFQSLKSREEQEAISRQSELLASSKKSSRRGVGGKTRR